MLHPFFDSASYPWHLPEADRLHGVLYRTIADQPAIDQIRRSCSPNILPFAPGAADAMWRSVLDSTACAGCLRELDRCLRAKGLPHVTKALDDVISLVSAGSENGPLNEVFVNRFGLRKALDQMSAPYGIRNVLVVRGEAGSGKTWSKLIVQHNAAIRNEGCIYLGEGTVTTLDEVLEFVFLELQGTVPGSYTTSPAWYNQIALAMIKYAKVRVPRRRTWIIMDDLGFGVDGVPKLDEEIRKLFDQLTAHISNPMFSEWFRFVLIAYPDGPLPTAWHSYSLEDSPAVGDVNVVTVSNYLIECAERKSKILSGEDANIIAQEVLDRCAQEPLQPQGTRPPLRRIRDELELVLGRL